MPRSRMADVLDFRNSSLATALASSVAAAAALATTTESIIAENVLVGVSYADSNSSGSSPVWSTASSAAALSPKFQEKVQHGLYQVANWFFVVSLLIPHHCFSWTIFVSRALMAMSYALVTTWACVELCAPDVFAWNVLLTAVTSVHVAYWSWRFRPARRFLQRPLLELYQKLFLPLDCPRELFVQLTSKSVVRHLLTGHEYFAGVAGLAPDPPTLDEPSQLESVAAGLPVRLSILLTGKLRVTFGPNDRLLHYVEPFQFIDSPEWYMMHNPMPNGAKISSPQVSIRAMEPSTFLQLDPNQLRQMTAANWPLKFLLDCLIGKDVSEKLYAVAEQTALLGHPSGRMSSLQAGGSLGVNSTGTNRSSSLGPWQGELSRSQSADAVHTCTQGQVRSINWRRDQTRKIWERRYQKLVPSPRERHRQTRRGHDNGKNHANKPRQAVRIEYQQWARSSRSRSRCEHIEEESDDVTQPLVPSGRKHRNATLAAPHPAGSRHRHQHHALTTTATTTTANRIAHQLDHQSNARWCNKAQFGETFV